MTEPLPETARGGLDEDASARAAEVLARCDALALGPGLGTEAPTVAAVRALLAGTPRPTVLDADGLNAFAGVVDRLMRPADSPPLVLTPHPGEAARLLGRSTTEVQDDRLGTVSELSRRSGAFVVLKGRHSLLAAPDGRLAANSTGNPGMASGGSGDVLTGILGAFLARGLPAWDALRLGVWAHGAAGDRAAGRLGEDGAIAGDLIGELPSVLAGLNPR